MSEMVERVARAIAAADGSNPETTWPRCVDEARAAIAAMREPTKAMKEVGYTHDQVIGAYVAMIDAALSDI